MKYLVVTVAILAAGAAAACPMSRDQQAQTPIIQAPSVGS